MTKNITKEKKHFGTNQWSAKTLNFITGCQNECRYCYGKANSMRRKQTTLESWENVRVRENDLKKKIKYYEGGVMFPSTHDIRPEHLKENIEFLKHILDAGNKVLVVSKPHLICIEEICNRFEDYKDKILFRFSMGSTDDSVLRFWEPKAPCFEERLNSLKHAFNEGYQTSVSCEPMLDLFIDRVVDTVSPFVTDTIWLGKINGLIGKTGRGRLELNGYNDPETIAKANELISSQSDKTIIGLCNKYFKNPKVMWKDSIEKVLINNGMEYLLKNSISEQLG
jgi:uncharacterized Fe-S cluster-containing radical SAM superfamily protein